jgi:hypothetical protein
MTTTYVLGAGASRDIGYPLASEMGEHLFEYMLNSADARAQSSAEYLIDVFGKCSNIEDLITNLQTQIEALKDSPLSEDKSRRMRLGNSRGWLVAYLREWFREIHLKPTLTYSKFSQRIVTAGDSVITFNYDDSLDRELKSFEKWDASYGYGFPLGNGDKENTSKVLLLKLHGSINWLVSLFNGATGGAFIVSPLSSMGNHPVIHRADLEFLGCENFSGRIYESGGAFPCLILPGRKKEFFYDTSFGHELSEFWDHLWQQASHALMRCDKIVICGYSLVPVDERACNLLLQKPRKNTRIEIICGSQTERIAKEFRNAGFTEVEEFKGRYFKNWVDAHL